MDTWYRVFGANEAVIEPAALLSAQSRNLGTEVRGRFRGDDLGWFEAELALRGTRLELQRFLAHEEGLRDDLNTWAAWLETAEDSPDAGRLMRQVIATTQLFTFRRVDTVPDDTVYLFEELCNGLCQFLARETRGFYQVDGKGFFDAEGMLLVPE